MYFSRFFLGQSTALAGFPSLLQVRFRSEETSTLHDLGVVVGALDPGHCRREEVWALGRRCPMIAGKLKVPQLVGGVSLVG